MTQTASAELDIELDVELMDAFAKDKKGAPKYPSTRELEGRLNDIAQRYGMMRSDVDRLLKGRFARALDNGSLAETLVLTASDDMRRFFRAIA